MNDVETEIGCRRSSRGSRLRAVRYGRRERHRPHAHPESSITLILRGGFSEHVGRFELRAEPLTVVTKPAGAVHSDEFATATDTDTVQIYLSDADETALCPGGRLGVWHGEHACPSARSMLKLAVLLRSAPSPRDSRWFEDLLVDLMASLGSIPIPNRGAAPPWLARAREALREPEASTADTAMAAGVHPVHLARQFRTTYGETPTDFRIRTRLQRAAALLTAGQTPLAEAAVAAGYADQPHMTRDLKRRVGVSPRALRRLSAAF